MHPPTVRSDRTSPLRRLAAAAVAVLFAATTTACGGGSEPPAASGTTSGSASGPETPSGTVTGSTSPSKPASASPSPTTSAVPALEVEVRGNEVTPVAEQVDLPVGETLVITVDADRAGELHVHADPEQTFTFDAGTKTFEVTLETPGSVDIEEHESEALVARVLVR